MRFFPHLLLFPFLLACASTRPEPPAPVDEAAVEAASNQSFLSEELDVDEYVDRFEGESREIAVHRADILAALEVERGADVADVGAGTGLFMAPLSASVGEGGKVYAIDISPGFLEHLQERIQKEGLENVETVLCTERSVELDPGSVDLAFVCDVYHHFTYPRSSLWSIHRSLRPGGRLVVVDFERIPGVSRDWLLEHVRAGKEVFRSEIESAGFTFEKEVEIEGLEENYFLVFRK